MVYRFILAASFGLLTACVQKDVQYYWQHPDKLQAVLASCPSVQPQHIDCETLYTIQKTMSMLAIELQRNPQDFGKKIIGLQEHISKVTIQLKKDPDNQSLHNTMMHLKTELDQRLAVARWLESPEG